MPASHTIWSPVNKGEGERGGKGQGGGKYSHHKSQLMRNMRIFVLANAKFCHEMKALRSHFLKCHLGEEHGIFDSI